MKYKFEKHDLLKVELTSIYDVLSEKDINQIKKERKDNACFYNAYMVSKMFKCDYVEGYSLPFAIKHCINRINGKLLVQEKLSEFTFVLNLYFRKSIRRILFYNISPSALYM